MNLDLLDGITSLVDKSLVRQEGDDEPRFFMLETIREYAGEILDACADRESTCRRHAQYIAALTESADRQLEGPDQLPWLDRLGAEHGNIRAAVNWARANDVGIALQILGSTARYAQIRGHAAEARAWFADILPLEGAEPAVRARALLAGSAFDWGTGEARIQEALNLSRDTRDLHGISSALARLAYRRAYEDRCNEARRLAEEGLAAARATHDPQTIDFALSGLAQVALWQGDRQTARELYEGILERDRSAQNSRKVAIDLIMLAHVAALDDDGNLVVHLAQEADEIHHELGDQSGVATAQLFWALGQILSGRFAEAEDRARRSLTLESNLGTRDCSPMLDALVVTASAKGHARRSAMLCGAAERMRRVEGMPLPAAVRERYRPFIEEVRRVLGDDAFDTAYRAGQALSQTEAIDLALGHGTSVE